MDLHDLRIQFYIILHLDLLNKYLYGRYANLYAAKLTFALDLLLSPMITFLCGRLL